MSAHRCHDHHASHSASPEARLLFYRGPARPVPSPANILSIERRDDDAEERGHAGGDGDVYPAHRASAPPADAEAAEDGFYFYSPEWTREAAELQRAAAPSPSVGRAHYRRTRVHPQPSAEAPPTPLSTSAGAAGASEGEWEAAAARGGGAAPREPAMEKQLRRALRRSQRRVEEELEPQLERARRELREREAQCERLRADNVILSEQLQRLQPAHNGSAAVSSVRSTDPTFLAAAPFAMPPPLPVPHEAGTSDDVSERLREASAEVVLLRRQLAALQSRCEGLEQRAGGNEGASMAGPAAALAAAEEKAASLWRAVVATCRGIAADSLGFTEALADVQDRLSAERGGSGQQRGVNPLRTSAEAWRAFARSAAPAGPPGASNHAEAAAATAAAAAATAAAAAVTSAECSTLLAALAAALQGEHGAVAASIEAIQQTERVAAESAARHQGVVEQVRREAERRIEEIEADHEAEVRTLENAIAELEQQVSVTAASRRPWTAGLFIRPGQEGGGAGSPTSAAARGSGDANGRRRESLARAAAAGAAANAGAAVDGFDGARRHEVRVEGETQTPLSLEMIQACLQKARAEPMRAVRREKEAELVEMMATEVEGLRRQLTDSRAVATRLRAAQRRFLGDVTLPLSYFDNFSSFPAYV